MPQFNINVRPELWQAIETQCDQQGDGPVEIVFSALSEYREGHLYDLSIHDISPVLTGALEKLQ